MKLTSFIILLGLLLINTNSFAQSNSDDTTREKAIRDKTIGTGRADQAIEADKNSSIEKTNSTMLIEGTSFLNRIQQRANDRKKEATASSEKPELTESAARNAVEGVAMSSDCVIGKCFDRWNSESINSAITSLGVEKESDGDTIIREGEAALIYQAEIKAGFLDDTSVYPLDKAEASGLLLYMYSNDQKREALVKAGKSTGSHPFLMRPRILFRQYTMYKNGIGVEKNMKEATAALHECFDFANKLIEPDGNFLIAPNARTFVGYCGYELIRAYRDGDGETKDLKKAEATALLTAKVFKKALGDQNIDYIDKFAFNDVKDLMTPALVVAFSNKPEPKKEEAKVETKTAAAPPAPTKKSKKTK